ncbi:Gfo/Idh/MocA family oxidoreductase [Myxococcota bacterium]|nr:Gfo/Idh/MocA family oxidoreductase [Myxococcota bacterium]
MKRRIEGKVRYAVVGLGHIAKGAILPAFAKAEHSELAALVSGDRDKLAELGERYGVEHRATYEEYEALLASGVVDAVYIALPNHMHGEYAMRAARHGVHVLCEKPLAPSSRECMMMIEAAIEGGVKLMTAYRLLLEPANLEARRIVQSGEIGEPRIFESIFSFQVKPGNLRLDRAKGGGTLWDIGVYCINAARHLFDAEPIEVRASSTKGGDDRFVETDEMTSVFMRFPNDRFATFTSSFGAAPTAAFRVVGTRGAVRMDPAYFYRGELVLEVTRDGLTERRVFPPTDQFAAELEHFSACLREGRDPIPDGQEGLEDVLVIEAALRSIRTGHTEPVGVAQG